MEKTIKTEEVKEEVVAKKETTSKKPAGQVKVKIVVKNTRGKEVPSTDYFYKGVTPPGFKVTCGSPVEREDLLSVFDKVFKPEDNILFYKQDDKEVYLILVPLKYSTSVSENNNSFDGDFQKHAISFLTEGSVNLDTLRQKLEKIVKFIKYTDR